VSSEISVFQFRTCDDIVVTVSDLDSEYASRIVADWLAGSDETVTFEGKHGKPDQAYRYADITEIWLTR
jgi:hypothetical protein